MKALPSFTSRADILLTSYLKTVNWLAYLPPPQAHNTDWSVLSNNEHVRQVRVNKGPETKNRILDAALNIFASNGYHSSRMDDIVQEARVSKGSIYFHFPNKERLFLALVDQFADLIERNVNEAIAQEEGIDRVRAAIESVVGTFARYRRPAKLLLVQAVGLGSVFEKKRQEVHERFARMIEVFLNEAVAQGDIAPVDTEVASHAWMGAIYTLVIQWVMTAEPPQERIEASLIPLLLSSVGYRTDAATRGAASGEVVSGGGAP